MCSNGFALMATWTPVSTAGCIPESCSPAQDPLRSTLRASFPRPVSPDYLAQCDHAGARGEFLRDPFLAVQATGHKSTIPCHNAMYSIIRPSLVAIDPPPPATVSLLIFDARGIMPQPDNDPPSSIQPTKHPPREEVQRSCQI